MVRQVVDILSTNIGRLLVLLCGLSIGCLGAETVRVQVAGEWCFIKIPDGAVHPEKAVILLHGNGETVDAVSSSWEKSDGTARFLQRLSAAGYLLAQSNHGATPQNGMWGNAITQKSVLALMDHLRNRYAVTRFHAIAISAGNATLLNLILNGSAKFSTATLIVPVLSLGSMYKCPGGVDRVAGISRAFDFKPASGCPGDPGGDRGFNEKANAYDPMDRIANMDAVSLGKTLKQTSWLGVYYTGDPKVPPSENIGTFTAALGRIGIVVNLLSLDRPEHNASELLNTYSDQIVQSLNTHSADGRGRSAAPAQ